MRPCLDQVEHRARCKGPQRAGLPADRSDRPARIARRAHEHEHGRRPSGHGHVRAVNEADARCRSHGRDELVDGLRCIRRPFERAARIEHGSRVDVRPDSGEIVVTSHVPPRVRACRRVAARWQRDRKQIGRNGQDAGTATTPAQERPHPRSREDVGARGARIVLERQDEHVRVGRRNRRFVSRHVDAVATRVASPASGDGRPTFLDRWIGGDAARFEDERGVIGGSRRSRVNSAPSRTVGASTRMSAASNTRRMVAGPVRPSSVIADGCIASHVPRRSSLTGTAVTGADGSGATPSPMDGCPGGVTGAGSAPEASRATLAITSAIMAMTRDAAPTRRAVAREATNGRRSTGGLTCAAAGATQPRARRPRRRGACRQDLLPPATCEGADRGRSCSSCRLPLRRQASLFCVEFRPQRAHRVMEARPDGAVRDVEDVGDLGNGEADEMVEHDDRSMVSAQAVEGASELVPVGKVADLIPGFALGLGQLDDPDPLPALTSAVVVTLVDDQSIRPGLEAVRISERRRSPTSRSAPPARRPPLRRSHAGCGSAMRNRRGAEVRASCSYASRSPACARSTRCRLNRFALIVAVRRRTNHGSRHKTLIMGGSRPCRN